MLHPVFKLSWRGSKSFGAGVSARKKYSIVISAAKCTDRMNILLTGKKYVIFFKTGSISILPVVVLFDFSLPATIGCLYVTSLVTSSCVLTSELSANVPVRSRLFPTVTAEID